MKKRALMLASVASMIEQFNIPNIKILQSLGYQVDVAANFADPGTITAQIASDLKARLNNMGVAAIHIAIPRSLSPILVLSAYKAVKQLVNSEHYNLIHCHSPIGSALVRIAVKKERKNNIRLIYTAHGFHFYAGAPLKNWLVFYPVEKWLSKYTDVLITINTEDYERAKKKFHAKRTVYIPGIGIDTEKFKPNLKVKKKKRAELGLKENDIMLFSVGELNKNKNHKIVIDAIAKSGYSSIKYFIAGEGTLKKKLDRYAKRKKVYLQLLGYRTDISELYQCSDIYILPSIREGLNVSLIEAMSSGLPCIASNIRGNKDLIRDKKYLAQSTNIDSFVQCLNCVVTNYQNTEYNNRNIASNFSIEHINAIMKQIYSE